MRAWCPMRKPSLPPFQRSSRCATPLDVTIHIRDCMAQTSGSVQGCRGVRRLAMHGMPRDTAECSVTGGLLAGAHVICSFLSSDASAVSLIPGSSIVGSLFCSVTEVPVPRDVWHAPTCSATGCLLCLMPSVSYQVAYFVNSGSEANDLALRIANCAAPGATHVAIMGGAYHGHTKSVIDLSPYKYEGPGGQGRQPHVHVLPCPDPYRCSAASPCFRISPPCALAPRPCSACSIGSCPLSEELISFG